VPAPILRAIDPTSTTVGNPELTITLTGENFRTGAIVLFNKQEVQPVIIDDGTLTARISPNLLGTPGTVPIQVVNPDGQASNILRFTIKAPAPEITGLRPDSATVRTSCENIRGPIAGTMTVVGQNFERGATVRWDGAALETSFESSTQLAALVPCELLLKPGNHKITVVNPDGQVSNSATFTVLNPKPTISALEPASTFNSCTPTVRVIGSGFIPSSVIHWNGKPVKTDFVNSSTLDMVQEICARGQHTVTVVNPDPGGGTSNGVTFSFRTID
jgi:hypothetical protein